MLKLSRRGLLAASFLPLARRAFAQAAPSRNAILTGSDDPLPEAMELRAGPLSLVYEPALGFIRYIRHGDREILRGIYAATRDKVWGTVPPRVSDVNVISNAAGFEIKFSVTNQQAEIDFRWIGAIKATPTSLRFEMIGQALSTFLKNRIGFAVLHPLVCAGKSCEIETADGARKSGVFPDAVSPNQPFLNLKAISHELAPGLTAEVRFEGDVFEMEDHRNWTDANYKTYCTPLALPFPVEIKAGTKIQQAVTITVRGGSAGSAVAPPTKRDVVIEAVAGPSARLPLIGFGMAPTALAEADIAKLRLVRPAHLRVDLRLDEDYGPLLDRALREAAALNAGLEAAVFVTGDADRQLAGLAARKVRVARWLVFQEQWLTLARKHLGSAAKIAAGTNAYFAELNRERPPLAAIDAACYSVNPQVHAFDNRTLIENLEGQGHTVRSAARFLNGRGIAVTPVTLRPRFNPQAKVQTPTPPDPRQRSLFGAAWTLGSVKYLAEAGAASVTYYETHGAGGLLDGPAAFPLYHVFASIAPFAGGAVTPLASSDPLAAGAMLLKSGARRRLLVANFTPESAVIRVSGAGLGARVRVLKLDERSFGEAGSSPEAFQARPGLLAESGAVLEIALGAYAVARVDPA